MRIQIKEKSTFQLKGDLDVGAILMVSGVNAEEKITKADADFTREKTGFVIGDISLADYHSMTFIMFINFTSKIS